VFSFKKVVLIGCNTNEITLKRKAHALQKGAEINLSIAFLELHLHIALPALLSSSVSGSTGCKLVIVVSLEACTGFFRRRSEDQSTGS
jgi:hypothetical protein